MKQKNKIIIITIETAEDKMIMIGSSSEVYKIFETSNTTNTYSQYHSSPISSSKEQKPDSYAAISYASKIAASSAATKINSFEDYKRMRGTADRTDSEPALWKEYQDFLKIRGCSNNLELIALNSTGLVDTDTLKLSVSKQMSETFDDFNIDIEGFDIETFVNSSSVEDIANYYNLMKMSEGSLDELRAARDFVETGLDNTNFDENFQSAISELLDELDDMIDFLQRKRI